MNIFPNLLTDTNLHLHENDYPLQSEYDWSHLHMLLDEADIDIYDRHGSTMMQHKRLMEKRHCAVHTFTRQVFTCCYYTFVIDYIKFCQSMQDLQFLVSD